MNGKRTSSGIGFTGLRSDLPDVSRMVLLQRNKERIKAMATKIIKPGKARLCCTDGSLHAVGDE